MSQHLIIQFIHPGIEQTRFDDGKEHHTMPWNELPYLHRRKFLASKGIYAVPATSGNNWNTEQGDLMFWGEWEPESKLYEDSKSIVGLDGREGRPKFLVRPYWKRKRSYEGLHNTDPFVFETPFKYIICLQNGRMKNLPAGSMILFGSQNRREGKFLVDTVFVVGDSTPYTFSTVSAELKPRVSDTYYQVSVAPLHHPGRCAGANGAREEVAENSCGTGKAVPAAKPKQRRLYCGATLDNPVYGMFSFFPCRRIDDARGAFARPSICLDDLETGDKGQLVPVIDGHFFNGKRYTIFTDPNDVARYWRKIVDQVIQEGLLLGIKADTPQELSKKSVLEIKADTMMA